MRFFYHGLIPTLWLAWVAYWVISAARVKTDARRESAAAQLQHNAPLLIGAALLAFPQISSTLDRRFVAYSDAAYWIAVALIAVGLGFASLARARLGANWSGTVTLKHDHELIRSGPYALVRHPIYTGLLLAIAGTALAIGQWRGLVALALIAIAIYVRVRNEERILTELFGESYRKYQAEVPALVPFWP